VALPYQTAVDAIAKLIILIIEQWQRVTKKKRIEDEKDLADRVRNNPFGAWVSKFGKRINTKTKDTSGASDNSDSA